MGFTHSVALLMLVNLGAVDRVVEAMRASARLLCLNREDAWREGIALGPRQAAVYVHVDDFGFFSESSDLSDALVMALAADLRGCGFVMKVYLCGAVPRFIVFVPESAPAGWALAADRLARLDAALSALVRAERPPLA
eukprot:5437405-Lingulodinium_polyedra.AAC.1